MVSLMARMIARHASATGGDAAEAFSLEQPTPAQVLERERIAAQLKREESREIPDVPRAENFRLTGSKRPADNTAQGSLF